MGLEKGTIDKQINIEENFLNPPAAIINEGVVNMPSKDNCILIMWKDDLRDLRVDTSRYLWDMLKSLGDAHSLVFEKQKDNWKLTITIDMEKV